jgi:hypothetical protein
MCKTGELAQADPQSIARYSGVDRHCPLFLPIFGSGITDEPKEIIAVGEHDTEPLRRICGK